MILLCQSHVQYKSVAQWARIHSNWQLIFVFTFAVATVITGALRPEELWTSQSVLIFTNTHNCMYIHIHTLGNIMEVDEWQKPILSPLKVIPVPNLDVDPKSLTLKIEWPLSTWQPSFFCQLEDSPNQRELWACVLTRIEAQELPKHRMKPLHTWVYNALINKSARVLLPLRVETYTGTYTPTCARPRSYVLPKEHE